jgi:prepilin-type N-terminal cleavage/methylation domain-containing protein
MREGRRQAGYTLLEMVVTLAVVAAALYLAAGMLREAHLLAAAAGRQLQDPLAGQLASRLRADVQGARAVASPALPRLAAPWSAAPLCLSEARNSGLLCWQAVGGELQRRVVGEAGERAEETWLRSLVEWRWRQPSPGLLDLEVSYWRAPQPGEWRLAGSPRPPPQFLATERLRLALRGGGRRSGW